MSKHKIEKAGLKGYWADEVPGLFFFTSGSWQIRRIDPDDSDKLLEPDEDLIFKNTRMFEEKRKTLETIIEFAETANKYFDFTINKNETDAAGYSREYFELTVKATSENREPSTDELRKITRECIGAGVWISMIKHDPHKEMLRSLRVPDQIRTSQSPKYDTPYYEAEGKKEIERIAAERKAEEDRLAAEKAAREEAEEKLRKNINVQKQGDELFGVKMPTLASGQSHKVPEADSKYFFDEVLSKTICIGLQKDWHMFLTGPRGCGKTSCVEQIAARLSWPVTRINLNSEVSTHDFLGQRVVEVNDEGHSVTPFVDGLLPTAMKEGHILILDELAAANPEILFVLQSVNEHKGKLVLAETNEVVEPHEHFRIVATDNTVGLGNEDGLYTGTQVLNASQLDRFFCTIKVKYLEDEQEASVIRSKHTMDAQKIDLLVKFANCIRQGRENGEILYDMSMRRLLAIAESTVAFTDHGYSNPFDHAFEVCVLNTCGASDRVKMEEYAQRVLGYERAA